MHFKIFWRRICKNCGICLSYDSGTGKMPVVTRKPTRLMAISVPLVIELDLDGYLFFPIIEVKTNERTSSEYFKCDATLGYGY
jgi:hypothetical protein